MDSIQVKPKMPARMRKQALEAMSRMAQIGLVTETAARENAHVQMEILRIFAETLDKAEWELHRHAHLANYDNLVNKVETTLTSGSEAFKQFSGIANEKLLAILEQLPTDVPNSSVWDEIGNELWLRLFAIPKQPQSPEERVLLLGSKLRRQAAQLGDGLNQQVQGDFFHFLAQGNGRDE